MNHPLIKGQQLPKPKTKQQIILINPIKETTDQVNHLVLEVFEEGLLGGGAEVFQVGLVQDGGEGEGLRGEVAVDEGEQVLAEGCALGQFHHCGELELLHGLGLHAEDVGAVVVLQFELGLRLHIQRLELLLHISIHIKLPEGLPPHSVPQPPALLRHHAHKALLIPHQITHINMFPAINLQTVLRQLNNDVDGRAGA
jgi:hypothetical protein